MVIFAVIFAIFFCGINKTGNSYFFLIWLKSYSVTIQMKATEQYFPVVLFIMLYKVVLILSLWMKSLSVTIQMKATEQYFRYTVQGGSVP